MQIAVNCRNVYTRKMLNIRSDNQSTHNVKYYIHGNIYFKCTFDTYVHFTSDTLRCLLKTNINMEDFNTVTLLLLKNNFGYCLHH